MTSANRSPQAPRPENRALLWCAAASATWCLIAAARDVMPWLPTLAGFALFVSVVHVRRLRAAHARPWTEGVLAAAGGAGVGVAMVALTYLIYPWFVRLIPHAAAEVRTLYQLMTARPWTHTAPLVVLIAIGEEMLWRGALLNAVRRRWPQRLSTFGVALGTSAIYAVAQGGFGSVWLMVVAFVCGSVWSLLSLRARHLLAPIASHLVWTLAVVYVWPLAR